jgi:hypothetical protein
MHDMYTFGSSGEVPIHCPAEAEVAEREAALMLLDLRFGNGLGGSL